MEQLCHKRELQPRSKPQNHPKPLQESLGAGGGGEGPRPDPVPATPRSLPPCPHPAEPHAGQDRHFGMLGCSAALVCGCFSCLAGVSGDSGVIERNGDGGAGGCVPSPWPQFPALPQSLMLEVLFGGHPLRAGSGDVTPCALCWP